jgi:hypothetical protein
MAMVCATAGPSATCMASHRHQRKCGDGSCVEAESSVPFTLFAYNGTRSNRYDRNSMARLIAIADGEVRRTQ